MHVLVLIADIIDSRKIGHRAEFQRGLKRLLAEINAGAGSVLLSPFTLTLGDEFQAVYGTPETVCGDLVRIMRVLHPVQVRFALAIGTLTTDVNPLAALEMDGPAFNMARDLLTKMKPSSTGSVRIGGPESCHLDLADTAMQLFGTTVSRLSRNNLVIMDQLIGGTSTKVIARELGVTPRAVNKAIDRHSLDLLVELTRELAAELRRHLPVDQSTELPR